METTICDPCQFRSKVSKGIKYCKSCQESLCEECANVHKSSKATKFHFLVNVKDFNFVSEADKVFQTFQKCKSHPEKHLEFYCVEHRIFLCSSCLLKHRLTDKCNIIDVANAGKATLKSDFIDKMKSDLQAMTRTLVYDTQKIRAQQALTRNSKIGIRTMLSETRVAMIKLFDELENEIFSGISCDEALENGKLEYLLMRINNLLVRINDAASALESTIENAPASDVFKQIMLTGNFLERCMVENQAMKKDKIMISYPSFKLSKEFQLFLNRRIPLVEKFSSYDHFCPSEFSPFKTTYSEFLRVAHNAQNDQEMQSENNYDQCSVKNSRCVQHEYREMMTCKEDQKLINFRGTNLENRAILNNTTSNVQGLDCPLLPYRPPSSVPFIVPLLEMCSPPVTNISLLRQPISLHHTEHRTGELSKLHRDSNPCNEIKDLPANQISSIHDDTISNMNNLRHNSSDRTKQTKAFQRKCGNKTTKELSEINGLESTSEKDNGEKNESSSEANERNSESGETEKYINQINCKEMKPCLSSLKEEKNEFEKFHSEFKSKQKNDNDENAESSPEANETNRETLTKEKYTDKINLKETKPFLLILKEKQRNGEKVPNETENVVVSKRNKTVTCTEHPEKNNICEETCLTKVSIGDSPSVDLNNEEIKATINDQILNPTANAITIEINNAVNGTANNDKNNHTENNHRRSELELNGELAKESKKDMAENLSVPGKCKSKLSDINFSIKSKTNIEIPLTDTRKFDISVIIPSSDKILVCDYHISKLMVFDAKEYKLKETFALPAKMVNADLLKGQILATCHKNRPKLSLFEIEGSLRLKHTFTTHYHAMCVQSVDDKNMLVSMCDSVGGWHMQIISDSGQLIEKLKLSRSILDFNSLTVIFSDEFRFGYRILQCCQTTNSLYCFEKDGKDIFRFKIKSPDCVAVLDSGIILVIDSSGLMHILSSSGQKLCEAKCCRDVTSIAINPEKDKILLTRYRDKRITVLSIDFSVN